MKNLAIVLFLFLALPSCAAFFGLPYSPPSASELRAAHPTWTNEQIENVGNRQIRIGMTTDQVLAAWGQPKRWNQTIHSFGIIMYLFYYSQTVHLRDGIVTIISSNRY